MIEFIILWEKIGDAPARQVGYAQLTSWHTDESYKLFNDIENWKEAVKDYKGFPVKRFSTPERFIKDISEIEGIDKDG